MTTITGHSVGCQDACVMLAMLSWQQQCVQWNQLGMLLLCSSDNVVTAADSDIAYGTGLMQSTGCTLLLYLRGHIK